MPRDSSGNYTLPTGTSAVSGEVISSSDYNELTSDVATALTGSVPVDGSKAMSADLPLGNNQITGLGDAGARTDATPAGQIADGEITHYGDMSGTDAKTITANSFAPTALADKIQIRARNVSANTGATTLDFNSLGAKAVVTQITGAELACVGGELPAGHQAIFEYDSTLDSAAGAWVLLNPARVLGDGLDDTAGTLFVDMDGPAAITDPATDDTLLLGDTDDSNATVTITAANFLKVISSITQLTSGLDVAADSLLIYDDSDSAVKRILANLLAGEVPLDTQTLSSAASAPFTLANATYESFKFEIFDAVPVTDNVVFRARLRRDGQGSVDSGATDYVSSVSGVQSNGTFSGGGSAEDADRMQLTLDPPGLDNTDNGWTGVLHVLDCAASRQTRLIGQGNYFSNSSVHFGVSVFGVHKFDSAVDQIEYTMSSGNIDSAVIRQWGIVSPT